MTGEDVLHSFAVPSLSLKVDAMPGRLNQTSFMIKREGVFYGQCSEICGAVRWAGKLVLILTATNQGGH